LLQRDVDVEVNECDNKGVFHGTIFINKKNYASTLLERGLAHTLAGGKSTSNKYANEYKDIEEKAKAEKKGLWKANLPQNFGQERSRGKELKELKEKPTKAIASEIVSAQEIYLQDPNSKQLEAITLELSKFNPDTNAKFEPPVKRGTPCVAKFSADKLWYRARVDSDRNDTFIVHFVDFGNSDECKFNELRKMPSKLVSIEAQARKSRLAYIRAPSHDHQLGDEVANFIKDAVWEQDLIV
jgi:staphylococcal nuclease domain-containing protein 1